MIDVSHLLDLEAVPDGMPQRTGTVTPRFYGGSGVEVSQTGGQVSIARAQLHRQTASVVAAASTPVDRFTHLDFRASWSEGVTSINAGRVYFTVYSDIASKFIPGYFTIPAATVALELEEGDEAGSVWLSLPRKTSDFTFTDPDADEIIRATSLPDGMPVTYKTRWQGFNYIGAVLRFPAVFAVTSTTQDKTPVEEDDFMVHLADVGFSSGLKNIHFGAVFASMGFDGELTYGY